jgi:hypothetical protein
MDDSVTSPAGENAIASPQHRGVPEPAEYGVGSPEHLRVSFQHAAAAADRAVGLWLARSDGSIPLADLRDSTADRSAGELRALRALVRASATAYARRLREEGVSPERMLVLVKAAAGHPGAPGFGVQELTDDVVRWSIDAFFGQ